MVGDLAVVLDDELKTHSQVLEGFRESPHQTLTVQMPWLKKRIIHYLFSSFMSDISHEGETSNMSPRMHPKSNNFLLALLSRAQVEFNISQIQENRGSHYFLIKNFVFGIQFFLLVNLLKIIIKKLAFVHDAFYNAVPEQPTQFSKERKTLSGKCHR